ncbi:hypothetical protein DFH27DRAFT_395920 [Peziza echinospora]|nr:hypothetical protein DFH27DRAFT_395920 [Peziza echinospora]
MPRTIPHRNRGSSNPPDPQSNIYGLDENQMGIGSKDTRGRRGREGWGLSICLNAGRRGGAAFSVRWKGHPWRSKLKVILPKIEGSCELSSRDPQIIGVMTICGSPSSIVLVGQPVSLGAALRRRRQCRLALISVPCGDSPCYIRDPNPHLLMGHQSQYPAPIQLSLQSRIKAHSYTSLYQLKPNFTPELSPRLRRFQIEYLPRLTPQTFVFEPFNNS